MPKADLDSYKQAMRDALPYLNRSHIRDRYRATLAWCRHVRQCEAKEVSPDPFLDWARYCAQLGVRRELASA